MRLPAAWRYSIAIIRFSIPYPTPKHRLLSSDKLLPFLYKLKESNKGLLAFIFRLYTTKQFRGNARCSAVSYTPFKSLHPYVRLHPYIQSSHELPRSVCEHVAISFLYPIPLGMGRICCRLRSTRLGLYSSDRMMRRSVYFGRGLGRIGRDY